MIPDIDIQLNIGNREKTIERMKQGIDDFYVFSHPPQDIDAQSLEFLDNLLVAIAHQDHPLVKKESISLADLCEVPFLMREKALTLGIGKSERRVSLVSEAL